MSKSTAANTVQWLQILMSSSNQLCHWTNSDEQDYKASKAGTRQKDHCQAKKSRTCVLKFWDIPEEFFLGNWPQWSLHMIGREGETSIQGQIALDDKGLIQDAEVQETDRKIIVQFYLHWKIADIEFPWMMPVGLSSTFEMILTGL